MRKHLSVRQPAHRLRLKFGQNEKENENRTVFFFLNVNSLHSLIEIRALFFLSLKAFFSGKILSIPKNENVFFFFFVIKFFQPKENNVSLLVEKSKCFFKKTFFCPSCCFGYSRQVHLFSVSSFFA